MDRGAWWATIHGVTREGHDSETEQQQIFYEVPIIISIIMCQYLLYTLQLEMSPKKSHSQRVNEVFYLQGALYL